MNASHENVAGSEIDSRRNLLGFGLDISFWNIGTYFIPIGTVMAALAAELTTDKALVGLIGTAWSAGWALPQLLVAGLIHNNPRKKPLVALAGIFGRQWNLLLGLWLYFTQATDKGATFGLLIASVTVFALADGIASAAWFDLFAKQISSRMRNRLVAVLSFIATVAGLLCNAFIVRAIFSSPEIVFPNNYAYVILLGWLGVFVSLLGFLLVKERVIPAAHTASISLAEFAGQLRTAITTDAAFRMLLLGRLLTAVEIIAAQFYVVFAKETLHLGDAVIGDFNTAYNVGSLAGIALLGWVAERLGSRGVIHVASVFQLAAPLIALAVAFLPAFGGGVTVALWLMVLVAAITGLVNHSMMLGFLNYTLDAAPPEKRSMYIGALNLLFGLMALLMPVGGVLINVIGAALSAVMGYAALFALCAVIVLIGLLLTFKLPRIHHN